MGKSILRWVTVAGLLVALGGCLGAAGLSSDADCNFLVDATAHCFDEMSD